MERRGFTLIEVVLVASVVGIIATVVFPQWFSSYEQVSQSSEGGVVGGVRTGIYLYGNESMATGRSPLYPSFLDNADLGESSPLNPFFDQALHAPVTQDWNKEGVYTYRGPTGQLYVYDPNRGTFSTTKLASVSVGPAPSPFGDILETFGDIVFYSSGAIVDRSNSLAYFPDYFSGTVGLTLVSGTSIKTNADGTATVTFPNGDVATISNINGAETYYKIPSKDGGEPTYLAVGRGQAIEWESGSRVLDSSSSYDRATNTYSTRTTYNPEGSYAGGSLSSEQGFIYESSWDSTTPYRVETTYKPNGKGGYTGTTQTSFEYSTDSIYASNQDHGEVRKAYGMNSDTHGGTQSNYSYDQKTGIYEDHYSGTEDYNVDHHSLSGEEKSNADHIEYDGSYRQNKKNGDYTSSVHYRYGGGDHDETYETRYDHKTRTYSYTYRDNKTGHERHSESKR